VTEFLKGKRDKKIKKFRSALRTRVMYYQTSSVIGFGIAEGVIPRLSGRGEWGAEPSLNAHHLPWLFSFFEGKVRQ